MSENALFWRLLSRIIKWESRLCNTRAGTCRDLTKAGSFHYTVVLLVSLAEGIHQPCFSPNKPNRPGLYAQDMYWHQYNMSNQRFRILFKPQSSKTIEGHWELLRNIKLLNKTAMNGLKVFELQGDHISWHCFIPVKSTYIVNEQINMFTNY